jgi:hypothetical protein
MRLSAIKDEGMLKIRVNDIVRMRKPHPCGGSEWVVTRVGADIGIRCLTCQRRVMLPRSRFEKRVKQVVDSGTPTEEGNG